MQSLNRFQFDILTDQPGLRHGIFGRSGGVSVAPFDSLNVGSIVGDRPENVRRNHERVCESLGVSYADLVTVRQVHGDRIRVVPALDRGRHLGEFDGVVTDAPGVPLIMRFADCVPILAHDAGRGILGLAHAGWRGTMSNIAGQLIQTMAQRFGSSPADLMLGIGPSIGPCCYAVGPDVIQAVAETFGAAGDRLLARVQSGNAHLDLWAANRLQLERAGVGLIETAGICTACHRDEFFSHRGDGGRTGRFPMVAVLQ